MKDRVLFFNGKFLADSQPLLSIYDSSIASGDLIVEVARTYAGKLISLEEHIERLYRGIAKLELDMPLSRTEIIENTYKLLEINCSAEDRNIDWQIIYYVSRGLESSFGLFLEEDIAPNVIIISFPLNRRLSKMADNYVNGVKLFIVSQQLIPANVLPPEIKSRGRLDYKLARIEAKKLGGMGVLLDSNGLVMEATGAALFFVMGEKLYTAPLPHVVDSITRSLVFEVAKDNNIAVEEKCLTVTEAKNCEEAFVTSSIIGLMHARSIDDHQFTINTGRVTDRIAKGFEKRLGVNFTKQAIYCAGLEH
ncbi:MAG TPA: aminotransferase class IV [Oligoflexia bacterium]|nr:aminotransferase class IV [Oligoflexia bacterium]HMP49130.1 aminotransferase class IV [Oligoflexia bacterium]